MWNNGGRYGCVNKSKGTQIDCTPGGECTGTVPRTKPQTPAATGNRTQPAGGTMAQPKTAPKVNDARAPMGGGVFGRPQTTGSGSGGPIVMRSNGDPAGRRQQRAVLPLGRRTQITGKPIHACRRIPGSLPAGRQFPQLHNCKLKELRL